MEVGKPLAASDMVAVDPEPPRPDLVTPWPDLVSLPRSARSSELRGGGKATPSWRCMTAPDDRRGRRLLGVGSDGCGMMASVTSAAASSWMWTTARGVGSQCVVGGGF